MIVDINDRDIELYINRMNSVRNADIKGVFTLQLMVKLVSQKNVAHISNNVEIVPIIAICKRANKKRDILLTIN